ncbi:MAG: Calx-beta domain-containing protein, partial [Fibrobacterota bacterium]
VSAGSSQATVVTDSVIGNLVHQSDRSFGISVAASGADLRPGTSTVTGTILDDDPLPLVRIEDASIRRDTLAGSKIPLWFRVRLTDPRSGLATTSGLPVVVSWRTIDSSAVAGLDYVAASGQVTISVGATMDSVPVSILGDSRFALPNAFKIVLDSVKGATVSDSIGIGDITGGARKPQLVLVGGSVVRRPASGDSIGLPFGYFLVDPLTGGRTTSRSAQTIRWSTFDSTAKASALDYKAVLDRAATLGASRASDTLKVTVLGLGVYAPPRQVGAKIEVVDTNWISSDLTRAIALGTIYDPFTVIANFVTTDTTLREDAAILNVVVRLNKASVLSARLPVVAESNGTTAKPGVNFRLLDDTAVFAPSDTLDTLRVQILHDTTYSGDLKIRLRLFPDLEDTVGVVEPSTVTITLRDADPAPRLSFQDTIKTVRESDTTISVVLVLDRPSSLSVAGTIVVAGGSAKSGINYRLGSGGFVFPPLSTRTEVALTILADHRYGPDRDVVLGWGSVVDSANVGFDALKKQERVVIVESDAKPTLGFALDTLVVVDVDGSADARIELSAVSDSAALASLLFDAVRSSANRIGLKADSGYGIRIDTGSRSTNFGFTFGNDGKVGDDRYVRLVLRNPSGALLGADSVLIVRIRNTNRAPVVVITTPVDSSRLSVPGQRIELTVGGVPQPPTDTILSQGWNTITRCATDTAGNTGCHTHHVWGDFTPPAVQVFKITGPNTHDPSKDTTWWGDKARTRFGNDTVWYWVRDSILNADGKNWRVVVDTHFVAVSLTGDSLFPTQVKACDSVGNCSLDTGWIDLKQSKPVVSIQTPPEGAHVVAGTVPVGWEVKDAGKTFLLTDLESVSIPGNTAISRCYTDDVGNSGCDTNKVVVEPVHVVKSYYLDTDGDGKVDAAVVELDSRWTGKEFPSFDFRFGDSLRTANTPDPKSPFYAGPSRGTLVVVGTDTFHVEAGPVLTDSVGNVLRGVDGYPLT